MLKLSYLILAETEDKENQMNCKATLKVLPGLVLAVALASPVFAQTTNPSAANAAAPAAENMPSNAYQSTKNAVKDTNITAKVKIALHNNKMTRDQDIHVDTHDGTVTLTGYASHTAAHQAMRMARETTGVVHVNNDMRTRG